MLHKLKIAGDVWIFHDCNHIFAACYKKLPAIEGKEEGKVTLVQPLGSSNQVIDQTFKKFGSSNGKISHSVVKI